MERPSISKALEMFNKALEDFTLGISKMLEDLTDLAKKQADEMRNYDDK